MKKIAWVLVSLMMLAAVATAVAADAKVAAEVEMLSVESSLIDRIGYDADTKTLSVQMLNSSDVYVYEDVPPSLFKKFLASDSKGAFFVEHIKGRFGHEKTE